MEQIEFWKMNGSGNDFILIDNRDGRIKNDDMSRFVKKACRRRESVGADGVVFVIKSRQYDFGWRYLNADGGEAEMCGNGARCVSRFAFLKGISGPKMTFETLTGPVSSEVNGRIVKVLMPDPSKVSLDLDLQFQQGWKRIDFVNTGVPHVVIGVDNLADHPVKEQGRAVRYNSHFSPEGTNADFMELAGPDQLAMRTYERGVEDETLACGTGAMACALVASVRGMVNSPVKVKTLGGEELTIHFNKRGAFFDHVWLEGNTSIVYQAQLNPEAL